MIPDWIEPAALPVLVALLGAVAAGLAPGHRAGSWIVILAAGGAFAACVRLIWWQGSGVFFLVDPLSAHVAILTAFVGLTTAWVSRDFVAVELDAKGLEAGRLDARRVQQYHALLLAFLGFMLLALLSNNLGVTWVALEAATISAVLVVGLPATADAVEASWKYFILCGVGIALALFGTIVLYLAAAPALGGGSAAMTWTGLARAAPRCQGTLLNLAFVFMLVGYGTKAGLAPLHGWMPDAHAEGPTPVSAVLSGSVLNVALVVILRLRGVLAANAHAIDPRPPIMALGLLSVLLASFSLWGRRDVKRFFAFSTIEQQGLVAFALGLGGVTATFAALLHMTMHTLAKSAVFHAVGRAVPRRGGQGFDRIAGMIASDRALGLLLAAGIVAVMGLPPFGLFASEFLIVVETIRQHPWLVLPLATGLLVGGWKLAARLCSLCLGEPGPQAGAPVGWAETLPGWLHLGVTIGLGLAMPVAFAGWLMAAASVAP